MGEKNLIYLDNASTTCLDPIVKKTIQPYLGRFFYNPSTLYKEGVKIKSDLEEARYLIKNHIGGEGNIFFTSSATESNNWALHGLLKSQKIQNIISSKMEHPSVYKTVERIGKEKNINIHWLQYDIYGRIDITHLSSLLQNYNNSLVSIAHAHHELGSYNDPLTISSICQKNGALFHMDMVQTLSWNPKFLNTVKIDLVTISSHKIHGPKGAACLYVGKNIKIDPWLTGGMQENYLRASTENIVAIIGFAKAVELAHQYNKKIEKKLHLLQNRLWKGINKNIPNSKLFSLITEKERLPTIIQIGFPPPAKQTTFVLWLSIQGIQVSSGATCMTTSTDPPIWLPKNFTGSNIRFSFSRYTKKEEIDKTVEILTSFYKKNN